MVHPAVVAVSEDGQREVTLHAELAASRRGPAAQPAACRRGPGRPGRRLHAEHLADRGRHARHHQPRPTWSSCSPDFGTQGVIDRFGQIEPQSADHLCRLPIRRQNLDQTAKLNEVLERLAGLEQLMVVPYTRPAGTAAGLPHPRAGRAVERVLPSRRRAGHSSRCHSTIRCTFSTPGHHRSAQVHRPRHRRRAAAPISRSTACTPTWAASDRLFYYTTCGWMMWNWLASVLAVGATAGAVRRLAVPPRPRTLDRPDRRRRDQPCSAPAPSF